MYDNTIVTIPISDYFKLFLNKYNISVKDDFFKELVEWLISLAKNKIYDITGDNQEAAFDELNTILNKYKIIILLDNDFKEMIHHISNELITYLIINSSLDKMIYLCDNTNNYLILNTYRI